MAGRQLRTRVPAVLNAITNAMAAVKELEVLDDTLSGRHYEELAAVRSELSQHYEENQR